MTINLDNYFEGILYQITQLIRDLSNLKLSWVELDSLELGRDISIIEFKTDHLCDLLFTNENYQNYISLRDESYPEIKKEEVVAALDNLLSIIQDLYFYTYRGGEEFTGLCLNDFQDFTSTIFDVYKNLLQHALIFHQGFFPKDKEPKLAF